jgi:hypothetical protein
MGLLERKLYKVLRNVGIKKNYIRKANSIEDLYLDEYDQKLLLFYFEDEFHVRLKKKEIKKLTTLPAVDVYLHRRRFL